MKNKLPHYTTLLFDPQFSTSVEFESAHWQTVGQTAAPTVQTQSRD